MAILSVGVRGIKHLCFTILIATLQPFGLHAQVCDPSMAPTGLVATYTPGIGVLLEWAAIPGSAGVQFKIDLPSGSSFSRQIIGFEQDQFLVPDGLLNPGVYTWRVRAACGTPMTYALTPVSLSDNFTIEGADSCPVTVMDIDGNVYNTVRIGDQCWMKENLKVERYQNGDEIPTPVIEASGIPTTTGAFAVYNNSPGWKSIYGLLYNWYAGVDSRGLCPVGWHVPTDDEWTQMITVLDPSTCGTCTSGAHSFFAGGPMKATGNVLDSTGLWVAPNAAATNSSGFSGLPGGNRYGDGSFSSRGDYGLWWSTSEHSDGRAWLRLLSYFGGEVDRYGLSKGYGLSVRCLRD